MAMMLSKKHRKLVLVILVVVFTLWITSKKKSSKKQLVEEQLVEGPVYTEEKNASVVKVLKLRMKELSQDRHTLVRNASFSQQRTFMADISKLNTPLHFKKQQPFNYTIDELAFGITTTVERLIHIVRVLRFWASGTNVQCLVTFYHMETRSLETVKKLFEMERIPCSIGITSTQRYVERYYDLVNQTWNLFAINKKHQSGKAVKWLLIGDDDTLWFLGNLLRVLNSYNYEKPFYLGDHSDHLESVDRFGSYYAYGGGGVVFSQPLAQSFVKNMSFCEQYKKLFGGDMMLGKCVTEAMKVHLSRNAKFHQMDIRGDATGYFESGIQGLVTLHHMFSWWSPVPAWITEDKEEIVRRFHEAYQSTSFSYLKRYMWIDTTQHKTLVLTVGYSVTVYDQILTPAEINAIEMTFCCGPMVRRSRTVINEKKTWYFMKSYTKNGTKHDTINHIYQNSAPGLKPSYILVMFYQ